MRRIGLLLLSSVALLCALLFALRPRGREETTFGPGPSPEEASAPASAASPTPTPSGADDPLAGSPARTSADASIVVRGLVRDAVGRPVPGARVLATRDPGLGRVEFGGATSATSNDEGRFELAVPTGSERLALRAEKDPEGTATVRLLRTSSESVEAGTLVLSPILSISGRVLDVHDRPIPGARVRPRKYSYVWPDVLAEAVASKEDGSFSIPCTKPGAGAILVADVEGFGLAMAAASCGGEPVVIRLEEGATVRGTVRVGSEPIRGARVALDLYLFNMTHGEGVFPDDSPRTAISGVDGSYELTGLPPGQIRLRAVETGHGIAYGAIELPGGGQGTVDFSLPSASTLSGIVLDAVTGLAVEGAVVNHGESRSGTDGRFVARRLTAWRFTPRKEEFSYAWVEKPGYAGQRARLPDARWREDLLVLLRPAARIRGIVLDPEGRAVPTATVAFEPDWRVAHDPDADTMRLERALTGADGSFVVDLGPGPYTKVHVSHPRFPPIERAGFMADSGTTTVLVFTLGQGRRVRGRVVREGGGSPVAGALVRAWREMRPQGTNPYWVTVCEARSDLEGSFVLRGFREGEGTLWLSVAAEGQAAAAREVALGEGEPEEIAWGLAPEQTLEGQVVDSGGPPVPESWVTCEVEAASPLPKLLGPFQAKSDGAGRFRIGGLPASPVHVLASAPYGQGLRLSRSERVSLSPPIAPVVLVLRERGPK